MKQGLGRSSREPVSQACIKLQNREPSVQSRKVFVLKPTSIHKPNKGSAAGTSACDGHRASSLVSWQNLARLQRFGRYPWMYRARSEPAVPAGNDPAVRKHGSNTRNSRQLSLSTKIPWFLPAI